MPESSFSSTAQSNVSSKLWKHVKMYPVILASLVLTVLSVGLVATIALTQQSQDIRQQAYDGGGGGGGGRKGDKVCGESCNSNRQCGDGSICNKGKCMNPTCKEEIGRCEPTGCTAVVPCGGTGCNIGESVCQHDGVCTGDGAGTCNCDGTATPSPGASCSTYAASDLNQDCSSTIDDYQVFVEDYIEQQP